MSFKVHSNQPFVPNERPEVVQAKSKALTLFQQVIDKSVEDKLEYSSIRQGMQQNIQISERSDQAKRAVRAYSKTLHSDLKEADGIVKTFKLGEDAFQDMHDSAVPLLMTGQLEMFDEAVKEALIKETVSVFKEDIVNEVSKNNPINVRLLDKVDTQFKKTLLAKNTNLKAVFPKVTPAEDGLTLSAVMKVKIGKQIDGAKIAQLEAEKRKIDKNHLQVRAKIAQAGAGAILFKKTNKKIKEHENKLAKRSTIIQGIIKNGVQVNSTMTPIEIREAIKNEKKKALKETKTDTLRQKLIKKEFEDTEKLAKKLIKKEPDFQEEVEALKNQRKEAAKYEKQAQGYNPEKKHDFEKKVIAEIRSQYDDTIALLKAISPKKGKKEIDVHSSEFWKNIDALAEKKQANKTRHVDSSSSDSSSSTSSSSSSSSSSDDSSSESD